MTAPADPPGLEAERFPFGKPINRPKPTAPAAPTWKQVPGAAPGIQTDGKHMRNNKPAPL